MNRNSAKTNCVAWLSVTLVSVIIGNAWGEETPNWGGLGAAQSPDSAVRSPESTDESQQRSSRKSSRRRSLGDADRQTRTVGQRISPGARSSERVLLSAVTPAVEIKIQGSREVEVGENARFQVTATNSASHSARGLFIRLLVPESLVIKSVTSTNGEVSQPGVKENSRRIVWQLDSLRGQSRERLDLELATSNREDFNLQVEWTLLPVRETIAIRGRQPELALAIKAPSEVAHGENTQCVVVLSNTGNGLAKDIALDVSLNGIVGKQYQVDRLEAGQRQSFNVALADLPAGEAKLAVSAASASGLRADAFQSIVISRPHLDVVVQGPKTRTAGTRANYRVEVTNSGTLAAVNVNGELVLSSGLDVIGMPRDLRPHGDGFVWHVAELLPGESKTFSIQCLMPNPGVQSVAIDIADAHGHHADAIARTRVEAKANVHLSVECTQDQLAVGEETTYELYLENSGSRAADEVTVIAELPNHLEVAEAAGHEATVEGTVVRFSVIPKLGAGESLMLTIRAKATSAGTDPIYVELATQNPDKRIAYESKTLVR